MFEWLKRKKVNPMVTDVERATDKIVKIGYSLDTIAKTEEALINAANLLLPGKRHFLRRNVTKQIKMKGGEGYGNGNT